MTCLQTPSLTLPPLSMYYNKHNSKAIVKRTKKLILYPEEIYQKQLQHVNGYENKYYNANINVNNYYYHRQ